MTTNEAYHVAKACLCPCHHPDSGIAACQACKAVLCKNILQAARECLMDPRRLIS